MQDVAIKQLALQSLQGETVKITLGYEKEKRKENLEQNTLKQMLIQKIMKQTRENRCDNRQANSVNQLL